MSGAGRVSLVGAGPGDPGLLTLHGKRCLEGADVVIYDALSNPSLLAYTRPDCEVIFTGKHGSGVRLTQAQITEAMLAHARAGRWVVRLKGGDPFVFGRGGEEAMALAAAGVPFRVIPGVTAALAALSSAAIPATLRGVNRAVIFATGHGENEDFDWGPLARTGQPIVIYMAMHRLSDIADALMRDGIAPETPAAVIASATLADERIVVATLGRIAAEVRAAQIEPPAIVVVGDIVTARERLLGIAAVATDRTP